MKTADDMKKLFPAPPREPEYSRYECNVSYDAIVAAFGHEILTKKEVGSYQGDTFYVLRDGDLFGWLTVGWGSCSGCDALQGCDSYQEVADLSNRIEDCIIWKDSRGELLSYLNHHDWEGDYFHGEEDEFKNFLEETKNLLKE